MAELNLVFGDPPTTAATPVPTLTRVGLALLVLGFLFALFLRGRSHV